MKKLTILSFFMILTCNIFATNSLNWGEGGPRYVTYMTITGKTGFITTPSAYCAPMGTLLFGGEFTFSSKSPYGALAAIPKITFAPHHMFEFGMSKALAYDDYASNIFRFDSTPFFMHYKFRFLDWRSGALAFGQDFDVVPDNSGSPSRGGSSTTLYIVFTGVTKLLGAFNFGFGKTLYFTRGQDALINFFASWIYSVEQLDNRLQFVFDVSNADYRAGDARFKVADEDRAYLNFQIRGVLVKTKKFQWTLMASIYDMLDIGGTLGRVNINGSLSTTFNVDLY